MPPPAGEPCTRRRNGVTLVNKTSADGARPAVQIFIAAPDSEVRAIVMQAQWQIANSMRMIEADEASNALRCANNACAIECLTGAKLHPRPQHQSNLLATPF